MEGGGAQREKSNQMNTIHPHSHLLAFIFSFCLPSPEHKCSEENILLLLDPVAGQNKIA